MVAMGAGVMDAEEVAVVRLTFCGRAEDSVGLGDLDETLGGGRVVGVAVWMVGFGERIEGPCKKERC